MCFCFSFAATNAKSDLKREPSEALNLHINPNNHVVVGGDIFVHDNAVACGTDMYRINESD